VNRFAVDASPPAFPSSGSIPWEGAHRRQFLYLAAGAGGEGGKRRAEEKMIIEGAWVLVIAVAAFAAIVAVVLLGSGKLYNPDRSHE
jgi:hypothetical protein